MSKISELSDGGVIQGGDTLIAVRSGGNVKVTYGGTTTANIDGGTIDGTVIGGSTAAAGTFTTFTSTGIDDNAASTAITLDASGNVMVGGSAPFSADTITLGAGGFAGFRNTSGSCAEFRRDGTDGSMIDFQKDGIAVGSIGSAYSGSRLAIGKDGHGLGFVPTSAAIIPHSMTTNQNSNGTTDLGTDGVAFRNLYLSGTGYFGTGVGIGVSSPAGLLHVDGFDYSYFSTNVGSATLDNAEQGLAIGWNKSSGGGETVLIANQGAGSVGGMAFATNTSTGSYNERMRIDSSGQVRLSNTTPVWDTTFSSLVTKGGFTGSQSTSYLYSGQNVYYNGGFKYSTSSTATLYEQSFGNHIFYNAPSGTAGNAVSLTPAMTLDSSGNLLVGTTDTVIWNDTSGEGVVIGPNAIQIARASDTCLLLNRQSTDGNLQVFASRGVVVGSVSATTTTTTYNTSSDQRLKDNIVDAPSASDDIDAIQVRSFDWKADGSHQKYGMVAQELMTVAPEAVAGDPESDDMMGVDYSKLVPMMLKEIQSLRARVAQLEGAN